MKCFVHPAVDACGSCKFCHKGVCSTCGTDSGYGLCCSEICKAELLSIKDMMDKNKMLYGQRRGRIPLMPIMLLTMGIAFTVLGIQMLSTGRGYFPLAMGALFLVLGIIAVINQKNSGLRS
jgi:hypothetical protein